MKILVERMEKHVPLPRKHHTRDAAFDLYAAESVSVKPEERVRIRTGLRIHIPEGYVGLIRDRSGLAWEKGLTVLAGVIDAGYTGEWMIVMLNTSRQVQIIEQHTRIAQVLILPIASAEMQEVERLVGVGERATQGFGSSGIR